MIANTGEVQREPLFRPYHTLAITFVAVLLIATGFFSEIKTLSTLAQLTGVTLIGYALVATFQRIQWHYRKVNTTSEIFPAYRSRLETATTAEQRQRIINEMAQLNLLRNANLSHLDLSETQLTELDLNGSDFTASKINLAELSNSDLHHGNLSYVNLRYATLFRANLRKTQLEGATLNSSDLREANLQGANLRAASLEDADLEQADLRGANLSHASLLNANLVNVKLTGANLNNCILPDGTRWQSCTDLLKYTHPTYVAVYNEDVLTAPTWIRNMLNSESK